MTTPTTPCGKPILTPLAALEMLVALVDSTDLMIASDEADEAVLLAQLAIAAAKGEALTTNDNAPSPTQQGTSPCTES